MDVIEGPVTEVLDGATFEMRVIGLAKKTAYPYRRIERVRIADAADAVAEGTDADRERERLEHFLGGKLVRCAVQTRDRQGRVVAAISLL